MYEKVAETGELAYFIYAPPLPFHLAPEERGPNRPFRDAKPWQCSVYYYWWAYLRENAGYVACCARGGRGDFADLHRDFGDVRGEDFIAWWEARGRDLFREPRESTEIVVHEDPSRASERHPAASLLVSVPLVADVDLSLRKLRPVLKEQLRRRREDVVEGERRARLGASRYPVETKPVLTSLHWSLETWKARKALGARARPADVAKKAKLPIHETSAVGSETADTRTARIVRRHLTAAQALIHNVGKGRFPFFSQP